MGNNQNNRRNNGQNNQKQQTASVKDVTQLIVDAESRTCTFTKTFSVNGLNKTGTFIAKYPTLTDRIAIGTIRAKMLNGAPQQSVDMYTDDLAFMMSYLKVLLIKMPKWYDFEKLEEDTLLIDVYKEVSNWVANFRQADRQSGDGEYSIAANDEEDMDSDETVSGSN